MTVSVAADAPRVRPVRVMIADDDSEVRTALVDLIGDDDTIEFVGAAVDADAAVALAAAQHPDVAVLDVRMPGGGQYAAREICRLLPGTLVIALSSHSDRRTIRAMTEAGAVRFLVKGAPESDLLATIADLVAAG